MMTTRRTLLAFGLAAALTGCRETPAAGPASPGRKPDPLPGRLILDSAEGLVLLTDGQRKVLGAGVLALDSRTAHTARPDGGRTIVERHDLAASTVIGSHTLEGRWRVKAAAPLGGPVVLTSDGETGSRTTLTLIGPAGPRRLELDGRIEPEAFATDNSSLFVLDWLPPAAPDRYRVRSLDLASGQVNPLLTRAKLPVPPRAEEEMRGQGRQAVVSPDGQVLYTLYTHQPEHQHTRDLVAGRPGGVHAFVHTLNLAQGWAYCVDLPAPFGEGPPAGHALALSPNGGTLYVADAAHGRIAVVDTTNLTVPTVLTGLPVSDRPAWLAAAGEGGAWLAAGRTLQRIRNYQAAERRELERELTGLQLDGPGQLLYLSDAEGVEWLAPDTGTRRGRLQVPGGRGLVHAV
ncbi:hypothetical protein [Longispora albida]|uniref:hypothetical protein n=1 Tax=Longispora albida TaxID=203523 RepID=UPI0003769DBD|nr:hypothetical protein [Longispora albida]